MVTILDIPIDLLYFLVSLTDYKTFFALSLTCKTFSYMIVVKTSEYETKSSRFREVFHVLPNGAKHGEYKKYFGYGKILEHKYFNNNKITGEYKFYHYNGNIKKHIVFYKDDKYDGNYKEYDNQGTLIRDEIYIQGQSTTTTLQLPKKSYHSSCKTS